MNKMKSIIFLLTLTLTSFVGADNSCPQGFVYDQDKQLCIDPKDPNVTARIPIQCKELMYKDICYYP